MPVYARINISEEELQKMRRERQIAYDRAKIEVRKILKETADKNNFNLTKQELFECMEQPFIRRASERLIGDELLECLTGYVTNWIRKTKDKCIRLKTE